MIVDGQPQDMHTDGGDKCKRRWQEGNKNRLDYGERIYVEIFLIVISHKNVNFCPKNEPPKVIIKEYYPIKYLTWHEGK